MNQTRDQNPDPGSKQPGQDVEQPGQQELLQNSGQGDSQKQSGSQQGGPSDGRGQRGSQDGDPREGRNQQDQAGGNQRQDSSPATPDPDADRNRKNERQGNEEVVDRDAQTSGKDVG